MQQLLLQGKRDLESEARFSKKTVWQRRKGNRRWFVESVDSNIQLQHFFVWLTGNLAQTHVVQALRKCVSHIFKSLILVFLHMHESVIFQHAITTSGVHVKSVSGVNCTLLFLVFCNITKNYCKHMFPAQLRRLLITPQSCHGLHTWLFVKSDSRAPSERLHYSSGGDHQHPVAKSDHTRGISSQVQVICCAHKEAFKRVQDRRWRGCSPQMDSQSGEHTFPGKLKSSH